MNEEDSEVVKKIENDEFLSLFLHPKAKNELLKSLTISDQVKKLGEGIEIITKELQKQVLNKHGDLIRQATHANKLETILNTMNIHMQNLLANAERLKMQIIVPYQALEMHTTVLGRLHLASHILRQVNRIQQLSKRLSNVNDPIQKATILQELDQLTADPHLTDIDAVTSELRNIRSQQQKVLKLGTSSLTQGIANENVSQTTTALQIFINMGTVKAATENVIEVSLGECRECLKSAFDTRSGVSSDFSKKPGPGRANLTSSQGFKHRVWVDLEKAFSEELYTQSKQIKFLQETLNTLNLYTNNDDIASSFWNKLCECIVDEITNSSSAVQQMLEADYPKLLKCFKDMVHKLSFENFTFKREILEKWENTYLSNTLNKLLEPTQSLFHQENSAPSHDQIDTLMRNITGELSVALVEDCLSEKIAKNVSKCIRMFAVKTEQQLATGPDAAQVIAGTPNTSQQLNLQLTNSMYYLRVQIERMLLNMKESLSVKTIEIINDSVKGLDNLTAAVIQPLIQSINSTIETIIITIHLEQDWAKLQLPVSRSSISCSPYMRELTQFILRVNSTYLSGFENKEVLALKCSDVVVRCIDLLVRHTSLVRPLSPGGRLRIQVDYTHLENSLKILYPYLSDLGRPYRLLKSMATLIVLSPQEIVQKQISGSSVPHSTVLLMLFSFAGVDLASPHQNAAWSLTKLSSWLDEHIMESDRLDLIAGALQRYENVVRIKNLSSYDPVYPVIKEFFDVHNLKLVKHNRIFLYNERSPNTSSSNFGLKPLDIIYKELRLQERIKNKMDQTRYRLEYQKSKELETADDVVKQLFSLRYAPRSKTVQLYLRETIDGVKRHGQDEGSVEAKIARWTGAVRALQEVMERFPRNRRLKVKLKELIDKRKKHLKYLRRWDYKKFEWLIDTLNIVYKPPPNEFHWVTRKESLQKLTDKYCDEIKSERLTAYRLQLESEQPGFLQEKIDTLEFIRKEQEECDVEVTVTQKEIDDVKQQLRELLERRQLNQSEDDE
ncbi:hypothetical protein RN001_007085 [Aquatica leii]|uniref:Conserved oligomeric Golgi complex subunit 5 n=1 Tax=Aquatica leii TaxID=1421715 RepID=A0AAN7SGN0_9COLE|nr:hypothetical protein RN001_007085 [Aquatica leii]